MNYSNSRELHLISINHQNASAADRLAFDLSFMDWFNLEAYARFSLGVIGWVKISTCNRIEILIDAPRLVEVDLILKKWIALSRTAADIKLFECQKNIQI